MMYFLSLDKLLISQMPYILCASAHTQIQRNEKSLLESCIQIVQNKHCEKIQF